MMDQTVSKMFIIKYMIIGENLSYILSFMPFFDKTQCSRLREAINFTFHLKNQLRVKFHCVNIDFQRII